MEKICVNAIKVWNINSLIYIVISILLSLGIYFGLNFFTSLVKLSFILSMLPLIVVFYQLIRLIKLSKILYDQWEFSITENMITIKNGILFEKIIYIPMSRVQYINTSQGPIMKKYNLREVTINTAGGSHSIVCLENERALEVQKIIANYAERSCMENEL